MLRATRHLIFLGLFAITACTAAAPLNTSPALTPGTALITLDVGTITFQEAYVQPQREPNVEHLFVPTPSQRVKQWTNSRLRTSPGSANILEVTIKEASVVKTPLPKTTGFKGFFTKDQAEKYDAKLTVELRVYAPGQLMSKADASADVTLSRTISEEASVASRENLFKAMNDELLVMMDRELEKNIRQYFGRYLK